MPVEAAVPVAPAAAEPSATPLESDLGEMFGDFSGGGESPEPDASAAGTTPAEPAEGTESESVDGTDKTPSDGPTPGAATADAEGDPFKDTTPATYVVNGQSIPVEDIRVFPQGGAVIRPEALPNVLSKLAERETLSERVRTRDAEYNTLAKVSEWTDQSSGKTYTGPEAAIEMRIGNASLYAENQLLVETLTNPEKLFAILATEQVPDGKGGLMERIVVNPTALANMQREIALTSRELTATLRDHYKGVIAATSKPAASPINYETAAPELIGLIAQGEKLDASVLTSADRAMLAKQLPYHTKDGKASLEWQELVKERIQLRTEQKASSRTLVDSTAKATKEGLANMAAAARGVKPAAKAATPAKPKAPAPAPEAEAEAEAERMADEGALFNAMIRSGSNAMRSAR